MIVRSDHPKKKTVRMKKLVFVPLSFALIKVSLSLINSLLCRLLWWIIPCILVVGLGEYITRIMINAETVTTSSSHENTSSQELDKTYQLTARQRRRRRQNEKRLLSNLPKSIEDLSKESNDISFLENFELLISLSNLSIENKDLTFDSTTLKLNNLSSINYIHTLNKDENVTKIFSLSYQPYKFYVVNGTVFSDVETKMTDELCSYRLSKVMKTDRASDVHSDELTDDDLAEVLFVTVQTKKHGVVINNNVYLTREKWHTLLPLNEDMYSCVVCQLQCDESTVSGHIESALHLQNLSKHNPLKKFDLSIIRKIKENLHCGVCNILFPITSYRDHENSKSHENHLLSSINKVSDMCEFNNTTQYFDANNIREPNNAPSRLEGIWNESINESVHESIHESENESIHESENESIHESINESENESEVAESCDGIGSDVMNEMDVFNENFGKNVYNVKIYEEEAEYCLPIEGVSYASMASKPKLDLPKFLKIDLGTKEVRVSFEYWHMITPTNPNELYCMVCTESFPARYKQTHCLSESHVNSLSNCVVVGAFEDYLIRNVNEKLYHCGHCNNLQFKNDMRIHVEKYHPIKKMPPKLPSINQSKTENKDAPVKLHTQKEKPAKSVKLDIFGYFKFAPFGVAMTVPNLACHMLMLIENRFYCAICDLYIQGELIEHVYEVTHMQLINMTPFIKPFQCNLTRAVRGSLHCGICNVLVPVEGIDDHNMRPVHTDLLARALGMVKNEKPKQEVKYHREEQKEFKTELDKFLETLPPDTRGVLSRLKIKNPMGETFDLTNRSIETVSNSIHKPDLTKPAIIYPNTLAGIKPNFGVNNSTVNYPKNETKPFHPSQMIPLSVVESQLGVKSDTAKQRGIQIRPENIEKDTQVKNNGSYEKNGMSVVKAEDKKTEIERKKSETEDIGNEDSTFVPDKIVLLKLKSAYFKVSLSGYHSLVPLGGRRRLCCACLTRLEVKNVSHHITTHSHRQTLLGHQCTGQLVRQMYHTYHCAVCNVTMSRSEVKMHLEWPPHIERYEIASKKLTKKDLKDMVKHAIEISLETQRGMYKEQPDPIHIVTYIQSTRDDYIDSYVEKKCERKSQKLMLLGKMVKISFESWHGMLVKKNGVKCIVCQHEITDNMDRHLNTENHELSLGMPFEKKYYPALTRKINKSTVNCVTCNLEIPNDDVLIEEHIKGRKHQKNHNIIIEKTSHTDSYSDDCVIPLIL